MENISNFVHFINTIFKEISIINNYEQDNNNNFILGLIESKNTTNSYSKLITGEMEVKYLFLNYLSCWNVFCSKTFFWNKF